MEKKNEETQIYDDAEKKMMRCLLLLPFDLSVDEILTRIPVKSLARFRCVSKRWLHLLTSDPNFATRQHEMRQRSSPSLISSRIQPETGTVAVHDLSAAVAVKGTHALSFSELADCISAAFAVKGTHALSFSELADCTAVSNPVNGLVACGYETIHRNRPLSCHYLLNPSTREIAQLPVTSRDDRWGVIGFGQEKSCYKLVRLFSAPGSSRTRFCKCEVLTVGTSNWRDIGDAPTALPFGQPVSLNGSIHWLALDPADADDYSDAVPASVILTFGLTDEEFRRIPVPERAHPQHIGLGDYGGSLCVTVLNDSINSWNIWVLSRKMQWEKLHVIPSTGLISYPRFIGVRDGKLLIQNVANHCFQPVYSYDPRTGSFSLVLASNRASPHLRCYAESLISPASLLRNVT